MRILEKIRNKSHTEKVRIIWIVAVVIALLLIILWLLTSLSAKNIPKDTTLFQTIGRGIKDIKENYKK